MEEKGLITLIIVFIASVMFVSTVATGAILYKKGVIKFNASVLDPVEESIQENVEVIKESEIKSEEQDKTEENLTTQRKQEEYVSPSKDKPEIISQSQPQLKAKDIFELEPIETIEPEIIVEPEPQPIEPVLEPEPEPEVKQEVKPEPTAEQLNSCVNNCDGLDGWYYSTDFYVCCNENNKICSCRDKEIRDYYCEVGSCKFSIISFNHKEIISCKDTFCVSPLENLPTPKISNLEINNNNFEVDTYYFNKYGTKCIFVREPIEIYWRTNIPTYSKFIIYKDGANNCCEEGFGQETIKNKEFNSLSSLSDRHMTIIENFCYIPDYHYFEITAETDDYLTGFLRKVKAVVFLRIDEYGYVSIELRK